MHLQITRVTSVRSVSVCCVVVRREHSKRRILHPVERRYRKRQVDLRFPTLNTRLYTDTMFSAVSSLRGNKCAQVFTKGTGYDLFYPLKTDCTVIMPRKQRITGVLCFLLIIIHVYNMYATKQLFCKLKSESQRAFVKHVVKLKTTAHNTHCH
jgi:hypothetical protein